MLLKNEPKSHLLLIFQLLHEESLSYNRQTFSSYPCAVYPQEVVVNWNSSKKDVKGWFSSLINLRKDRVCAAGAGHLGSKRSNLLGKEKAHSYPAESSLGYVCVRRLDDKFRLHMNGVQAEISLNLSLHWALSFHCFPQPLSATMIYVHFHSAVNSMRLALCQEGNEGERERDRNLHGTY